MIIKNLDNKFIIIRDQISPNQSPFYVLIERRRFWYNRSYGLEICDKDQAIDRLTAIYQKIIINRATWAESHK